MSVIVFFSRTYWASAREKVSAFRGCSGQAITGGSAIVEDVECIPLEIKLNNCWASIRKRFRKSLGFWNDAGFEKARVEWGQNEEEKCLRPRTPKEGVCAHDIITAQEAVHLVSRQVGVAILTTPTVLGVREEGVVIRPFSDVSLSFETCVIIRTENDSRSANEFARSFLRRYAYQRLPPRK
jgi:hypothetical protein